MLGIAHMACELVNARLGYFMVDTSPFGRPIERWRADREPQFYRGSAEYYRIIDRLERGEPA